MIPSRGQMQRPLLSFNYKAHDVFLYLRYKAVILNTKETENFKRTKWYFTFPNYK